MFVCNLKLNGNIIFKCVLIFIVIIAIVILSISTLKLFKSTKFNDANLLETCQSLNVEDSNYTNILEDVYNNLDKYVGQDISYSGYVYRLPDMKDNEFVLARDMLINSDSQSVVVGFLCNVNNSNKFKDGTWVDVSGNIIKGYYHNQIPVIDIKQIKEIKEPKDTFVYPPNKIYTSIVREQAVRNSDSLFSYNFNVYLSISFLRSSFLSSSIS